MMAWRVQVSDELEQTLSTRTRRGMMENKEQGVRFDWGMDPRPDETWMAKIVMNSKSGGREGGRKHTETEPTIHLTIVVPNRSRSSFRRGWTMIGREARIQGNEPGPSD
jgi:hypothetical protein